MNQRIQTVKKSVLTLLVGCLSASAFANNNPGDNDTNLSIALAEKSGKVVVHAWNLEADAPATIEVLNRSGTTIYKEALETGKDHKKKYDFSQLKSGRYSLVLSSQSKEVARPFVVDMNGVVREDDTEAFKNFAPIVLERQNDHRVQVMFVNPGKAELTLQMVDSNDHVIYSEKVEGKASFGKSINTEKLPKGFYRLRLSNYDYSYVKDLML